MLVLTCERFGNVYISDYEMEDYVTSVIDNFNKFKPNSDDENYYVSVTSGLFIDFIRISIIEGRLNNKDVILFENDIKFCFDIDGNIGVKDEGSNRHIYKYPVICDIQIDALIRLMQ